MTTIKCKRCLILFTIVERTTTRKLCNNCQVETMEERSKAFIERKKPNSKRLNRLVEEVTKCIEFTGQEPKLNTDRLKEILKPLINK